MGQVNHSIDPSVAALTETTGVQITYEKDVGCKLIGGVTYYFECSSKDANSQSIGLHWDATFAGTITVEDCNFGNVTGYEASALANWVLENPAAYIAPVGTVVWTASTGVVTTGAVGASMIRLVNSSRRLRLKVVVTTTGYLRVATHGKE